MPRIFPTTLLLVWSLCAALSFAAPPASPSTSPDVLVVCPAEFRQALAPWEAFRRGQGHELAVIDVPQTAVELRETIRRVAADGNLKYVVLVGDVPTGRSADAGRPVTTVPTNYLPAKINTRWGSEPHIASDTPYADVDGDGLPDLAIGRIPADSPAELAAVVSKILRYEQQASAAAEVTAAAESSTATAAAETADDAAWQRRLHVVAGIGGFGAVTDALIEAAATQMFMQTVPADFELLPTMANPDSPHCPPPGQFRPHVHKQFCDGCLAWIYLGHGRPEELDRVRTPQGEEPILTIGDLPKLRCGSRSPLAVLVACYTGALDARVDCLGEEMLLAEDGPVAVIAATRVTMPYGNSVLGCELLRGCFAERGAPLGIVLHRAQRRALAAPAADDALRLSLDSLAGALSPAPVDLATERREHVAMYHLLGDPLVTLRVPAE